MKKTYQAPEVKKVIYNTSIMEGQVTSQSIGMTGKGDDSVNTGNGPDLDSGFGGDGTGPIYTKGTGRFWDDEY